MSLDANETYGLHINELAYRLAIGLLLLHVSLASTLGTQLLCLIVLLQRKKVIPIGITSVRRVTTGLTLSLAVRLVAPWVRASQLALFVLAFFKALLLPLSSLVVCISCLAGRPLFCNSSLIN